jgi:PPOX class probable F420-dependent enzyme
MCVEYVTASSHAFVMRGLDMPDLSPEKRAHIENRLANELIIWLATAGPDGRPHNVPVWYWWDGETVLIFSQPENRKIRNMRHQPKVVLALDTADEGEDVVIIEGEAEFLSQTTVELMTADYAAKYAHLFPRIDSSAEQMAREYSLAIRVTPTKFISW